MILVKSWQQILISVVCFLSFSCNAYADDTVGQMIWVKGVVKAIQEGKSRDLARRSPVFEHDTIMTDTTGSGEVTFTDSSVLTLRSDTELKIDEYAYKKGAPPSNSKSVMSLIKGGFRTITGAIPKENPDGYQVNTPVATIGVRGTDYSAYYTQAEGLVTKIDVGRIVIRNANGAVELGRDLQKVYSIVKLNEMPQVLQKPPAVFTNQPATTGAPIAPIHPGRPGGPPKTVSSFCVGLLKGLYKSVTDFFV
jgi:hypothetical protein